MARDKKKKGTINNIVCRFMLQQIAKEITRYRRYSREEILRLFRGLMQPVVRLERLQQDIVCQWTARKPGNDRNDLGHGVVQENMQRKSVPRKRFLMPVNAKSTSRHKSNNDSSRMSARIANSCLFVSSTNSLGTLSSLSGADDNIQINKNGTGAFPGDLDSLQKGNVLSTTGATSGHYRSSLCSCKKINKWPSSRKNWKCNIHRPIKNYNRLQAKPMFRLNKRRELSRNRTCLARGHKVPSVPVDRMTNNQDVPLKHTLLPDEILQTTESEDGHSLLCNKENDKIHLASEIAITRATSSTTCVASDCHTPLRNSTDTIRDVIQNSAVPSDDALRMKGNRVDNITAMELETDDRLSVPCDEGNHAELIPSPTTDAVDREEQSNEGSLSYLADSDNSFSKIASVNHMKNSDKSGMLLDTSASDNVLAGDDVANSERALVGTNIVIGVEMNSGYHASAIQDNARHENGNDDLKIVSGQSSAEASEIGDKHSTQPIQPTPDAFSGSISHDCSPKQPLQHTQSAGKSVNERLKPKGLSITSHSVKNYDYAVFNSLSHKHVDGTTMKMVQESFEKGSSDRSQESKHNSDTSSDEHLHSKPILPVDYPSKHADSAVYNNLPDRENSEDTESSINMTQQISHCSLSTTSSDIKGRDTRTKYNARLYEKSSNDTGFYSRPATPNGLTPGSKGPSPMQHDMPRSSACTPSYEYCLKADPTLTPNIRTGYLYPGDTECLSGHSFATPSIPEKRETGVNVSVQGTDSNQLRNSAYSINRQAPFSDKLSVYTSQAAIALPYENENQRKESRQFAFPQVIDKICKAAFASLDNNNGSQQPNWNDLPDYSPVDARREFAPVEPIGSSKSQHFNSSPKSSGLDFGTNTQPAMANPQSNANTWWNTASLGCASYRGTGINLARKDTADFQKHNAFVRKNKSDIQPGAMELRLIRDRSAQTDETMIREEIVLKERQSVSNSRQILQEPDINENTVSNNNVSSSYSEEGGYGTTKDMRISPLEHQSGNANKCDVITNEILLKHDPVSVAVGELKIVDVVSLARFVPMLNSAAASVSKSSKEIQVNSASEYSNGTKAGNDETAPLDLSARPSSILGLRKKEERQSATTHLTETDPSEIQIESIVSPSATSPTTYTCSPSIYTGKALGDQHLKVSVSPNCNSPSSLASTLSKAAAVSQCTNLPAINSHKLKGRFSMPGSCNSFIAESIQITGSVIRRAEETTNYVAELQTSPSILNGNNFRALPGKNSSRGVFSHSATLLHLDDYMTITNSSESVCKSKETHTHSADKANFKVMDISDNCMLPANSTCTPNFNGVNALRDGQFIADRLIGQGNLTPSRSSGVLDGVVPISLSAQQLIVNDNRQGKLCMPGVYKHSKVQPIVNVCVTRSPNQTMDSISELPGSSKTSNLKLVTSNASIQQYPVTDVLPRASTQKADGIVNHDRYLSAGQKLNSQIGECTNTHTGSMNTACKSTVSIKPVIPLPVFRSLVSTVVTSMLSPEYENRQTTTDALPFQHVTVDQSAQSLHAAPIYSGNESPSTTILPDGRLITTCGQSNPTKLSPIKKLVHPPEQALSLNRGQMAEASAPLIYPSSTNVASVQLQEKTMLKPPPPYRMPNKQRFLSADQSNIPISTVHGRVQPLSADHSVFSLRPRQAVNYTTESYGQINSSRVNSPIWDEGKSFIPPQQQHHQQRWQRSRMANSIQPHNRPLQMGQRMTNQAPRPSWKPGVWAGSDELVPFVCSSTTLAHITCNVCENRAKFLCSGCRRVAYCSHECQVNSWKDHRGTCLQYSRR